MAILTRNNTPRPVERADDQITAMNRPRQGDIHQTDSLGLSRLALAIFPLGCIGWVEPKIQNGLALAVTVFNG